MRFAYQPLAALVVALLAASGPAHAQFGDRGPYAHDATGPLRRGAPLDAGIGKSDVLLTTGQWPVDLALHAGMSGEPGADAMRQAVGYGPALFGHVDFGHGGNGPREVLLYQAAYLLGSIYAKRGTMFTMRVQYTF